MIWPSLGYTGFISPTLVPEIVESCRLAGKTSRASLFWLRRCSRGRPARSLPNKVVVAEGGSSASEQPVVGKSGALSVVRRGLRQPCPVAWS